jgi:hypothetical protein
MNVCARMKQLNGLKHKITRQINKDKSRHGSEIPCTNGRTVSGSVSATERVSFTDNGEASEPVELCLCGHFTTLCRLLRSCSVIK